MTRFTAAILLAALCCTAGLAHYNMLLPAVPMVQKGDKVAFLYQFGHPFEHELFEAPAPRKLLAISPDGKTHDLAGSLEKFKTPGGDGKDVGAQRFSFTPQTRGDYWFVLTTPPIWFADSEDFAQDVVQTLLHVQTQHGWEKAPGTDLRMAPLTRPYGLLPGVAFQAQVLLPEDKGVHKNAVVEIERYNGQKPKDLPIDELITFKARTDPNGVFTCTLPEPGWWCMTAQHESGKLAQGGKEYPLRRRVTLWVHVEKKAP